MYLYENVAFSSDLSKLYYINLLKYIIKKKSVFIFHKGVLPVSAAEPLASTV